MSWTNLFSKKVRQMKTQTGASKSKVSKRMTSITSSYWMKAVR